MTAEQAELFALMGVVFGLLIWGRLRYDLVAFLALFAAVALGLVPADHAFEGFGHAAVAVVALVFVVSRGLQNSGAIEWLAARVARPERPLWSHIALLSAVGAALSAVINNVAALALLMTVDIQTAKKAGRSPASTLMPLSFATILGGMITLIGTPPNIVIAQYRAEALGAPFGMFDFSPVGLIVATAGILYVALIGWRLLPRGGRAPVEEAEASLYIAEVQAGEGSKALGQKLADLAPLAEEHDVNLLGLTRGERRLPGLARWEEVREGDVLTVEGEPAAIEGFMAAAELNHPAAAEAAEAGETGDETAGAAAPGREGRTAMQSVVSGRLSLVEAIVPEGAWCAGRTAAGLRLAPRQGVVLLGVSRQGRRFRERIGRLAIQPGDVLLLLGPRERMGDVLSWLGAMALEGRETPVLQREKATFAALAFLAAVAVAALGWLPLPVALVGVVGAYALGGVVRGREVYESIEWKAIVLLACLVPIAGAMEETGGAKLIADALVQATQGWPPIAILLALMAVTMTLSDFLNNVATALIAAPIGVGVARAIGAPEDPFLMGVAVAASCAFLTPIGHKNNTIIMGPGGYRFGDYWRMGLPLELLVLAVGGPAVWWIWG
ncbi:SLC13 family permease [Albimonas sp. CAU 1670]|uniref:SLC13 family permease n=1 Tax=Albimonas sp. CAU 1670 TaxID=3032599 RepID=UPI0023D9FF85|nr:SLC13 family permease [Albimonas sp. CAU 1670]MDF2232257.1 SLC13 family permease [Albimonas sp. CAU 1670]